MNNNNYNNNEREDKMNLVNEGVLPPDELDDRDERREEQERARSRETVADIVADIRERAENAMRNGERLVHNEAVANMLTFVADRIEAEWKRDEERHNPRGKNYEGGNAAAMREALDAALVFIGNLEIEPYSPLDEAASELRQRIIDALYAPPKAQEGGAQ